MDISKVSEEKLREASCFGDIEAVHDLVEKGVNINAQHEINGWTPLHWACKRGFINIVAYLLQNGADKSLASKTGETPICVTEKEEILALLGQGSTPINRSDASLPITPNYLAHPQLSYKVETDGLNSHAKSSNIVMNCNKHQTEEELVLKIRIAHSPDPDFIEVELPYNDLSYSRLMRVCCEELGIDLKHVIKIRKLPDTVIRKDKDVRRLCNLQELELVLTSTRATNGTATNTNSNSPYTSIPGFRNCTILY